MEHNKYLKQAIMEARAGMGKGEGGPFGAVIVRGDQVIGSGHNTVLATDDPTAHAEINAIRDACREAGSHHLTGAVIYSNFEPCPMCLSAIYWADIRKLYYCADRQEAEKAGFMDNQLYREVSLPVTEREVRTTYIREKEMDRLLNEWDSMEGKVFY